MSGLSPHHCTKWWHYCTTIDTTIWLYRFISPPLYIDTINLSIYRGSTNTYTHTFFMVCTYINACNVISVFIFIPIPVGPLNIQSPGLLNNSTNSLYRHNGFWKSYNMVFVAVSTIFLSASAKKWLVCFLLSFPGFPTQLITNPTVESTRRFESDVSIYVEIKRSFN